MAVQRRSTEAFHPGTSSVTTRQFDPATGDYTRVLSVLSNEVNVLLDRDVRAPHTDEYSVGIDRELRLTSRYLGRLRRQARQRFRRLD